MKKIDKTIESFTILNVVVVVERAYSTEVRTIVFTVSPTYIFVTAKAANTNVDFLFLRNSVRLYQ